MNEKKVSCKRYIFGLIEFIEVDYYEVKVYRNKWEKRKNRDRM